jgi:hypothetical protein
VADVNRGALLPLLAGAIPVGLIIVVVVVIKLASSGNRRW